MALHGRTLHHSGFSDMNDSVHDTTATRSPGPDGFESPDMKLRPVTSTASTTNQSPQHAPDNIRYNSLAVSGNSIPQAESFRARRVHALEDSLASTDAPTSSASGSKGTLQDFIKKVNTTNPIDLKHASIFMYTIHVVDAKTGSDTHLKRYASAVISRLITNKFVKQEIAPSCTMLPNSSRVMLAQERVKIDTRFDLEAKQRGVYPIEDVILHAKAFDAQYDSAAERRRYLHEYTPLSPSSGKASAQFIRLEATGAAPFRDTQDLYPTTSATSRGTADKHLKVYFTCDTIKISEAAAMEFGEPSRKQDFESAISTFVGQVLAHELQERLDITSTGGRGLIQRGPRVYVDTVSQCDGVVQRNGVCGKIKYDAEGNPSLSVVECSAPFFQSSLISDFLLRFFGPAAACCLGSDSLERAARILKGVKVNVPVKKDQAARIVIIAGLSGTSKHAHEVHGDAVVHQTPATMKYPGLPQVNVGSAKKPEWFPAELCKIQGDDQLFRGQLPLHASETTFHPHRSDSKPLHKAPGGDPFARVESNRFKFIFVNILAEDTSGKLVPALTSSAMAAFRYEMGQRFNRKLEGPIAKAGALTSTHVKLLEKFVKRFGRDLDITTAVVIAVPHDLPAGIVDSTREAFDCEVGGQCVLVNGEQITKRYHPLFNEEMVKYTGQIVRKIFARAMEPALEPDDVRLLEPAVPDHLREVKSSARVYGIHVTSVQDLQDLRGDRCVEPATVMSDGSYVINIISINPSQDAKGVVATEHIFSAPKKDDKAREIVKCMQLHHEFDGQPKQVYLSGCGMQEALLSQIQVEILGAERASSISTLTRGEEHSLFVAMFSTERKFGLTQNGARVCLHPGDPGTGHGSWISNGFIDVQRREHDFAVGKVFSKSLDPASSSKAEGADENGFGAESYHNEHPPCQVWRIEYLRSCEALGPHTAKLRCLENNPLPAILHLAQQASRRARFRLKLQDANTRAQHVLRPVHRMLKNTLYFL